MPGLHTTLQALVNFAVPQAEISDPAKYLARFDANDPVPSRKSEIRIFDLREEFEAGMGGKPAGQQLDETGCAASHFCSATSIPCR